MSTIETEIHSQQHQKQSQAKNKGCGQNNKVQLNNVHLKREQLKRLLADCFTDKVQHLLFWDNAIGCEGLPLLSTINWSSLKVLRLAQNNITLAAIKYLNLGNFSSVQQISLYKNPMGNQSVKQLSKGQWTNLEKLLLHECNLSSEVMDYLGEGNWPKLTHVNLGFNKIEPIAVMSLSRIERPNNKKQSTTLVKNNIKGIMAIQIGQSLNFIKISV